MILAIVILLSAAAGAWLYRARGRAGGLPHVIEHGLWSLLLTAPLWLVGDWWAILLAAACAYGATTMGHGSGLDMGESRADDPDELWRHRWAPNDTPAHDTLFMAVNGTLIVLAPAVAAAYYVDPLLMLVVLGGAAKGPCYYLAWKLTPNGMDRTAMAERAFGAVAGASCATPWVYLQVWSFGM